MCIRARVKGFFNEVAVHLLLDGVDNNDHVVCVTLSVGTIIDYIR